MSKNALNIVSDRAIGTDRISIELLFEIRDIWVGLYWDVNYQDIPNEWHLDVYICLIPMFPLHIKYIQRVEKL